MKEFPTVAQSLVGDRTDVTAAAKRRGRRHGCPLTRAQERLFFGVVFGAAFLVQLAVVWMPLFAPD